MDEPLNYLIIKFIIHYTTYNIPIHSTLHIRNYIIDVYFYHELILPLTGIYSRYFIIIARYYYHREVRTFYRAKNKRSVINISARMYARFINKYTPTSGAITLCNNYIYNELNIWCFKY